MKKFFLFAATVAMLLTTSCNKESNAPENVQLGENEFMVSIDNGAVPQKAPAIRNGMTTMTHIDDNNFVYWDMGDRIYINGTQFSASTSGDNVIFTEFYGDEPMPTPQYHAFYPVTDIMYPAENTAELLSGTMWDALDDGVKHLPMYACSNDKYLTFYNIFAVLKITIPYDNVHIVILRSNVTLSGSFEVEEYQEEETELKRIAVFNSEGPNQERHIEFSNGSKKSNDVIYVAVPAGVYEELRIALADEEGYEFAEKSLNFEQVNVLEVNKIYTVGTEGWDIYYDE